LTKGSEHPQNWSAERTSPRAWGRNGLENAEAEQLFSESDTAVGEQEVGATGMKRPALAAMGEAQGGIGPVSLAGEREDERPASFGVEARFGLERHQRNGRREPATTAGRMSAMWSALADLGMRLGIESRRRYRAGGHHITLENERERQQEPAFLSPRMMQ